MLRQLRKQQRYRRLNAQQRAAAFAAARSMLTFGVRGNELPERLSSATGIGLKQAKHVYGTVRAEIVHEMSRPREEERAAWLAQVARQKQIAYAEVDAAVKRRELRDQILRDGADLLRALKDAPDEARRTGAVRALLQVAKRLGDPEIYDADPVRPGRWAARLLDAEATVLGLKQVEILARMAGSIPDFRFVVQALPDKPGIEVTGADWRDLRDGGNGMTADGGDGANRDAAVPK